jgi:hypothetical protein
MQRRSSGKSPVLANPLTELATLAVHSVDIQEIYLSKIGRLFSYGTPAFSYRAPD